MNAKFRDFSLSEQRLQGSLCGVILSSRSFESIIIILFCFVVTTCDQVHDVETTFTFVKNI